MDAAGLLHRELIAVQVAFQRLAQFIGGAMQQHFQNAGVGSADGFVLVGLQAELADTLHMLQLTQHVVKMRLHAGDLKGLAVELVVQFQQAGLPVRLGQVGFQQAVVLNDLPVLLLLLLCQAAAHPVQDLFFQRKAGKLLQLHPLQVDGSHMGTALRLDVHHVGNVEHDQRLPHGGAADAHLLRKFPVVHGVAGLQLHGDDPAADGLIRLFPRTQRCHCSVLPSGSVGDILVYDHITQLPGNCQ